MPAFSFATMKQKIYEWAVEQGGVTTIWQEQGEPAPARPFIGLKILTPGMKLGNDEIRQSGSTFTVCGNRKLLLSVNVYGENAQGIGLSLQGSLEKPSAQAELRLAGLSVVRIGDVGDLTSLLETKWQSRAQFDVEFSFAFNADDSGVDYIDSVEGTAFGKEYSIN